MSDGLDDRVDEQVDRNVDSKGFPHEVQME
jgi:hypothetical protein